VKDDRKNDPDSRLANDPPGGMSAIYKARLGAEYIAHLERSGWVNVVTSLRSVGRTGLSSAPACRIVETLIVAHVGRTMESVRR
jgi:hypothetical protein